MENRKNTPQNHRKNPQFADAETISFEEVPASNVPAEVWQTWASIIKAEEPHQAPPQAQETATSRLVWSAVVVLVVLTVKIALMAIYLAIKGILTILYYSLIKIKGLLSSAFPAESEAEGLQRPANSVTISVNVEVNIKE